MREPPVAGGEACPPGSRRPGGGKAREQRGRALPLRARRLPPDSQGLRHLVFHGGGGGGGASAAPVRRGRPAGRVREAGRRPSRRPDGQRTRRPSSQDGAAGRRGPAGRRKGASAHAQRLPPAHSPEEAPPSRRLTQSCLPWRRPFGHWVSRDLRRTRAQHRCLTDRVSAAVVQGSACFLSCKKRKKIDSSQRWAEEVGKFSDGH